MAQNNNEKVYDDFHECVNMTASQLESWLKKEESRSAGWSGGGRKSDTSGGESVGHKEGGHIVQILRKRKSELGDKEYRHMKKVNGYVKRHLAQKPSKESIEDSRWRYSLMNWGHDPLKD